MAKLVTISVTVLAEDNADGENIAMAVYSGADSNIKIYSEVVKVEMDCLEAEFISETPVDTGD